MSKVIPHVKIEKKLIDNQEICETSMYGDMITLSSMIFSAMMTNEKFAECVVNATKSYVCANTDERVILN